MKKKTLKLAIEALKKQTQVFAIDANLYEEHLSDCPHAENAYNQRRAMFTAIAELEKELKTPASSQIDKKANEIVEDEDKQDGWDAFNELWLYAVEVSQ